MKVKMKYQAYKLKRSKSKIILSIISNMFLETSGRHEQRKITDINKRLGEVYKNIMRNKK